MTVADNQFEGGANLTKGSRRSNDEILAELLQKRKHGRVTVGAPGDIAVTFAEAYASTSYTVTGLAFEDTSGGVHADLDVKTATKATTGFTVTVAGGGAAGILHWSTELD